MTPTEKKLVSWVKEVGAGLGQLDILVEDIKCRQATLINSKGTLAQVKYLLQHKSPLEFKKLVWHEMQMLNRYKMKTQSKAVPEKNVKIRRKK